VCYGKLKRQSGAILRELCRPRGVERVAGQCLPDPVPLGLSIAPQYRVADTRGLLKGKRAVRIQRELWQERRRTGVQFWAAG